MSAYPVSLLAPCSDSIRPFHAPARNADLSSYEPCLARMQLYERALGRDPRNHLLLLDLAREYGRHGRLTGARCVLRRVVRLYPESVGIRSMVAAAYEQIGLPQQAHEQYQTALLIDPCHPHSATIRAEITRLQQPVE